MKRYATIFGRVKRMLLFPAKEWKIIADEKRKVSEIFLSFLLPFSLLTMVVCYIGYGIVGSKQDMFGLVASAKLGYQYAAYYSILLIASIFISAFIISFVAPFFNANKSFNKNFRLVVYSFTPSMGATLLLIIPALSPLVLIAGIYNLLLLYIGLERMTNVPKDKKWGYFFATIATLVFVFFAVSKILYRIILD
jgi:hypothetical protein